MQSECCSLRFLPSYFKDDTDFSVVRYRRTSKQHRIRSGTIILDFRRKKILVIQSYKRFWGLPKGHVEENESVIECAIRETLEETGIRLDGSQLERSYSVFRGDGEYFIVNGNDLRFDPKQITSTEEITGIGWVCLKCLTKWVTEKQMIINSHFRVLLPIIEKELYAPESSTHNLKYHPALGTNEHSANEDPAVAREYDPQVQQQTFCDHDASDENPWGNPEFSFCASTKTLESSETVHKWSESKTNSVAPTVMLECSIYARHKPSVVQSKTRPQYPRAG